MKQIPNTNYWIPDCETHYLQQHRRTGKFYWDNYQGEKLQAALQYVKKFDIAVDAGANVGFLSLQMAKCFKSVYAFEPARDCFECLEKNTELHRDIINIYPWALGETITETYIELNETDNTGNRQINRIGKGEKIRMQSIDECDFGDGLSFIKLDVQGYELFVLKGAKQSIMDTHPVILIEIEEESKLPNTFGIKPSDALKYLLKMGYSIKERHGVDFILSV